MATSSSVQRELDELRKEVAALRADSQADEETCQRRRHGGRKQRRCD